MTFGTLNTILTIENLNPQHSLLPGKSDTGQHSQFLQCFKPNVQLYRKYIRNKKQEMCWETKIATKGFSLLLQNGKLVPESSPSAGSVYLLIYFQTHDDFHCDDYESHVDNNDDVSVILVDDEIDDYEYDACFV